MDMGPTLSIREAHAADLFAALDLKRAAATRAYSPFATPEALDSWLAARATPEKLTKLFETPDGSFLLAEAGGELVGMAYLEFIDADSAYFGDLYCATDGRGVGSELFDACLRRARLAGVSRMSCHCFELNARAQDFLAKKGFEVVDVAPAKDDLGAGDLLELARDI